MYSTYRTKSMFNITQGTTYKAIYISPLGGVNWLLFVFY